MNAQSPRFVTIAVKTIVTHTVTYMLMGVLASTLFDYRAWFAESELRLIMRQFGDPWIMAGPLFQPVRGLLFAFVFYLLREHLFGRRRGWLVMWVMLVVVGILSTFGPAPGSIEGMLYTIFPVGLHVAAWPEGLLQSLLLAWILCYWVDHPEKRWLSWLMGAVFLLVIAMISMGLLVSGGAGG